MVSNSCLCSFKLISEQSSILKVLVYGLGRSGSAVCELLISQGHDVIVFDRNLQEVAKFTKLGFQNTSDPAVTNADICIAAPGVPYDHPDLVTLRAHNIETIGEVEWVYRTVDAEIIGITATAGKTTATTWLSEVLARAGLDALAGGNIEPALAKIARKGATLVTEMSSFQLERCPTLKPSIAIVLNLGVDHLDRHGSIAAYHKAKHNLIANLDKNSTFVYNQDDTILNEWANASTAKTLGYSLNKPADAYLEGDELILMGKPLLSTKNLQITGKHFYANLLAVALASKAKGLSLEQINQGLMAIKPVSGRYSLVNKLNNINFIEDSIATRTLAVKAALAATPKPIVWILGGEDKGADFAILEALICEKVVLAIGIGKSGQEFTKAIASWTNTKYCSTSNGEKALFEACNLAVEYLITYAESKGTVLLAPLAASFDQFKDYKDRALVFRKAVDECVVNYDVAKPV